MSSGTEGGNNWTVLSSLSAPPEGPSSAKRVDARHLRSHRCFVPRVGPAIGTSRQLALQQENAAAEDRLALKSFSMVADARGCDWAYAIVPRAETCRLSSRMVLASRRIKPSSESSIQWRLKTRLWAALIKQYRQRLDALSKTVPPDDSFCGREGQHVTVSRRRGCAHFRSCYERRTECVGTPEHSGSLHGRSTKEHTPSGSPHGPGQQTKASHST